MSACQTNLRGKMVTIFGFIWSLDNHSCITKVSWAPLLRQAPDAVDMANWRAQMRRLEFRPSETPPKGTAALRRVIMRTQKRKHRIRGQEAASWSILYCRSESIQ